MLPSPLVDVLWNVIFMGLSVASFSEPEKSPAVPLPIAKEAEPIRDIPVSASQSRV